MSRIRLDELTRLAFVYGEQDRRSMAECWPKDAPEWAAATALANQMNAYRVKRWGRTQYEADTANAPTVDVTPGGLVPTVAE